MNKNLPATTAADFKLKECIDNRKSFLLDAGAGSGKTYSLVTILNYIDRKLGPELTKNSQKVACITFTNVAKDEIIKRTERNSLFSVHTIHDFLWNAIKTFQKDLKAALLVHNSELPDHSKRKKNSNELLTAMETCKSIRYSDQGSNYLEGRIFHDDLLDIALVMFKLHPMLARIVASCYPLILVDEYQDTSEKVISILLNYILETDAPPVVGFFGDTWQSIYSSGIGEIPMGSQHKLELIQKEENYRCSLAVINVLNRIRTDIKQTPVGGKNVKGSAVYINLSNVNNTEHAINQAREIVQQKFGWFADDHDMQILFLTHRLISRHAGYEELWTAYNNRGGVYKDWFQSGNDEIACFLSEKIAPFIDAWYSNKVGRTLSLLNPIGKTWASAEEKIRISGTLDKLVKLSTTGATIGEILIHVWDAKLISFPDKIKFWLKALAESTPVTPEEDAPVEPEEMKKRELEAKDRAFFKQLLDIPYRQIQIYHQVFENYFPYSTKHSVKGDEFDTVFVVLSDVGAKWNLYSFGRFLAGEDERESRLLRTRNLFYVCCSRSKNRLVVIDLDKMTDKKKHVIEQIFGINACVIKSTGL